MEIAGVCAPANLFLFDLLAVVWAEEFRGIGFVFRIDAEQGSLGFGQFPHFAHFVDLVRGAAFRFVLLTLGPALVLVPLFLLARLLLLALSKSRSSSRHTKSPKYGVDSLSGRAHKSTGLVQGLSGYSTEGGRFLNDCCLFSITRKSRLSGMGC
jgi:hypothetical protein